MAAPPTYRLLPHFDCQPGGAICLGAVLLQSSKTKTADPNSSVSEATVPPPPDTVTSDTQEYDPAGDDGAKGWHYADNIRHGGGGGIFAEIPGITALSGGFGMNKSKEMGIVVSCTKLVTSFTTAADRPNAALKQEVIRKALDDMFVQSYIKKHWRPWLYLVTGIKIAENATIQYTWGKRFDVQGDIGIDGSSAAVPMKLGPTANVERVQEGSQSEFRKGPFILAYRLIRLRPKSNGSFVEKGDRRRGNYLYGEDDPNEESSLADEDAWEIEEVISGGDMQSVE